MKNLIFRKKIAIYPGIILFIAIFVCSAGCFNDVGDTDGTGPTPAGSPVPPTETGPVIIEPLVSPTGAAPSFEILLNPREASAPPGGDVVFELEIIVQNGFSDPIELEFTATAPLFKETYDLGTVQPGTGQVIEYTFNVPENVPSGITIEGILQARSGELTRAKLVTLHVI